MEKYLDVQNNKFLIETITICVEEIKFAKRNDKRERKMIKLFNKEILHRICL